MSTPARGGQPAARTSPRVHVALTQATSATWSLAGVLVLAHRGLPASGRPENTVAAVHAAFTSGAHGVEVDLRLTADGILVLSHDQDLRRMAAAPLVVADAEWSRLRDVAGAAGVRLARVEELLLAAAGRRVVLEVKPPPPRPGARARTVHALVERLGTLRQAGLPLDVTVSSFSAQVAADVRRLLPAASGVRTALLAGPFVRPSSLLRQALDHGHDEVHPHVTSLLAAPDAVATAHALGVAVVPWTVNRRRDIQQLARLGADAVITDDPAAAHESLEPAGRL